MKSNATPSDAEVIAIRALITGAEASVEKLRRVPARDDASQVIESQLLETIEAYWALLSPVRYIPSEILQEIFFHYADNRGPNNVTISTMPWRLGHISHRWRKIALSLPSLWDNLPKIYLSEAGMGRSYARALICLLRRSGTSPTLKLNIGRRYLYFKKGYSLTSIIKKIMLHSERIEQLCIEVNATTMPLIQRFKGCLPNLQILRVLCSAGEPASSIDVFETAPALRQVAILATLQQANRFLLPWSQITHFEDETDGSVGNLVLLYPSSLRSLTKFHIYRTWYTYQADESALLYPYRSTTLPNLRTLRIVVRHRDYKDVDLFLESLTIPAVEVIKIHYMNTLIPHLISMISGSCGLSRLQKLAFRTIPLQTGELSALLKLTPHLIELDIDIPPAGDLLRLIYSEGEVMLVPMLQALYMHIPVYTGAQIVHLDTLAQVRCELGFRKDSEDATILSLRPQTWTTLHTFRIIFDSRESRKSLRKRLNNWSSSLSLEEAKAVDMLGKLWFPKGDYTDRNFLKNILSRIESYEITNKVLHVGIFFWMLACRIFKLIFFIFYSSGDRFTHRTTKSFRLGIKEFTR